MMITENDLYYMQLALKQAELAQEMDEVPVGAVLVYENRVLTLAHNLRETTQQPSAHAEFLALEAAAKKLGSWRLLGTTLYVTLEPCPMCAGAIVNARVPRVLFGAYDPKAGAYGTLLNMNDYGLNHKPEVVGGVLERACGGILREYFRGKRRK